MVERDDHEIASLESEVGDDYVVVIVEADVPGADDRMASADQQARDGFDHVLIDEEPEVSWR